MNITNKMSNHHNNIITSSTRHFLHLFVKILDSDHQFLSAGPVWELDEDHFVSQSLQQPHVERGHARHLSSQQTILKWCCQHRYSPGSCCQSFTVWSTDVREVAAEVCDRERSTTAVQDTLSLQGEAEHGVDVDGGESGRRTQGGECLQHWLIELNLGEAGGHLDISDETVSTADGQWWSRVVVKEVFSSSVDIEKLQCWTNMSSVIVI